MEQGLTGHSQTPAREDWMHKFNLENR
jgi:hypothetical protein